MIKSPEASVINLESLPVRTTNNKVLVRVDYFPDEYTGGIIKGDSSWKEMEHTARYGTVVIKPQRLWERYKCGWGMDWKWNYSDFTLSVGETVFFGLRESFNCPALVVDKIRYYVIDFSELILVKRNDTLVPLNGYVLVQEYNEKPVSKIIYIPNYAEKQNKKKGVVMYVGLPNIRYRNEEAMDAIDVEVGDIVNFRMSVWTELEDERYVTLESGLGYVQRRWINYKL